MKYELCYTNPNGNLERIYSYYIENLRSYAEDVKAAWLKKNPKIEISEFNDEQCKALNIVEGRAYYDIKTSTAHVVIIMAKQ